MRSWLLLLVACKSPLPSSAPSPTACKVDADCTIVTVGPHPDDACCDVTMTAAPMARAHLAFVRDWRPEHCVKKSCDPLALPGAPGPACSQEARCVASKCTNACN